MTARGARFGDDSDYNAQPPTYHSPTQSHSDADYSAAAPAFRPSEIYGRPVAPSDVWVDDSASTILPGVSRVPDYWIELGLGQL